MSSDIVMIFGAFIRNTEIEDALKQVGKKVYAYVVPSNGKAPATINGMPIKKISELNKTEREMLILIPSMPGIQDEIYSFLKANGFTHIEYFHRLFASLPISQRHYYSKMYDWNINFSIPACERQIKGVGENLKIYVVTSHFNLHKTPKKGGAATDLLPNYSTLIQAGAALTDIKMCERRDDVGDNISYKNSTYCELTALYWLLKNEPLPEYVGFNFYSRIFNFNETELSYILSSGIDAIVPEPVIVSCLHTLPKILPQNHNLIEDFLEKAVAKTHLDYLETFRAVFKENIRLPSNIFIVQKNIFTHYVKWLFDVIETYEDILMKAGREVPPRHIGYMAERLQTVYFLKNSSALNILFAKRKFLF